MRFTHANRHCPDHPYDTLKRCEAADIQIQPVSEEQSSDIMRWLQKYREDKQQAQAMYAGHVQPSTPTRKTPVKRLSSGTSPSASDENGRRCKKPAHMHAFSSDPNLNSAAHSPLLQSPQILDQRSSVRKGLMCELDMNAGRGFSTPTTTAASSSYQPLQLSTDDPLIASSPLSSSKFGKPKLIAWKEPIETDDDYLSDHGLDPDYLRSPPSFASTPAQPSRTPTVLNPKKKWLKDSWHDDLGTKPLDSSENGSLYLDANWQMATARQQYHNSPTANPNQMRPTVLMVASKDTTRPLVETNSQPLLNRSLDSALTYHTGNNGLNESWDYYASIPQHR